MDLDLDLGEENEHLNYIFQYMSAQSLCIAYV